MLLVLVGIITVAGSFAAGYILLNKVVGVEELKQIEDPSTDPKIDNTQDFMPFKSISDDLIDLYNHDYVAVLECSSTNYNLRTAKEKQMINTAYASFLNSLNYRIIQLIQTRTIDNTERNEKLRKNLIEAVNKYPQLKEQANLYYNEMLRVNYYVGNGTQKKKYILIPYSGAKELEGFSDKEKYLNAVEELDRRSKEIANNISVVGVKAKRLRTKDLVELIYASYHRENYLENKYIASGEYLTNIVEREENFKDLTIEEKLDQILYETQGKIMNVTSKSNIVGHKYLKINKELEKMREEIIEEGGD